MTASRARRRARKREYSRKSPEHGVGFDALYAAVILSAVRDAQGTGELRQEAMKFMRSDWCQAMLEVLNLPDRSVLLGKVRGGLPREVLVDLGTAADAVLPRGRIKVDLAVQPPLFV